MKELFSTVTDETRLAWHGLVRRPFYAVATIVMLALAVAANAVAFGICDEVYLAPLPYRHASRLVVLRDMRPLTGLTQPFISPADYARFKRSLHGISAIGLYVQGSETAAKVGGKPRGVTFAQVTPSWFRVLGLVPALGRLPSLAAGRPGGPKEAMISYKFWQSDFGGANSVLRRTIDVGDGPMRIVGVLPRRYSFAAHQDLLEPAVLPLGPGVMHNINEFGVARLQPGVTVSALDKRIDQVRQFVIRGHPQGKTTPRGKEILDAQALRPILVANANLTILPIVLQGMALLLLVLAIANAANLAVVRQRARDNAFAVRRILGASRGAVMRLLLLEQAPIAVAVAVLAGLLGLAAQSVINSLGDAIDVTPFHFGGGWPVVMAAMVLSVVSVIAIAAIPLVQVLRQRLGGGIGQGSKATTGRSAIAAQRLIGLVQIILALALLIASGSLGGSLYAALNRPLGFQFHHRLIASVLLPDGPENPGVLAAIEARLRAQSRFQSVGGFGFGAYPFSQSHFYSLMSRDRPGAQRFHANMVTPDRGYFRTLGITIRTGRRISTTEYRHGQRVMIVGEGLAHRLFGTADPVGKTIDLYGLGKYRVVGVAGSVVWRVAPWHATPGTMYFPVASVTCPGAKLQEVHVAVTYKGRQDAARRALIASVEAAVPGAVVSHVRSYRRIISIETAFRTLAAWMAGSFALIALVIAGLGVYAVSAYVARSRLPEFGVRAMLGASPSLLLRVALTDAAWLLGLGLAGGTLGGYMIIRAMSPLLFHIEEVAPLIFMISLLTITGVVIIAAWRPASVADGTPVKTLLDAS